MAGREKAEIEDLTREAEALTPEQAEAAQGGKVRERGTSVLRAGVVEGGFLLLPYIEQDN